MAQMPKSDAKLSVVEREIPQIKPNAVTIDHAGNKTRTFVVDLPDALSLQDLMDHPEVFKLVQAAPGKSLAEDDELKLRWFNRRAFAVVDWADSSGVGLCKPTVLDKRDRSRVPFEDDNFQVKWTPEGGWTYHRRSDGVRMSNSSWPTWEAARGALLREQYPAKLGV